MKVDSALPVDVGLTIDEGLWSTFQKLLLVLVSLAFIVDSLANNVLSVTIPAMMRDWHIARADFSVVVALGWVAVAVGTILAGLLADKFGRKPVLLASILTFGLATAFGALINDIHQLLVLRIVDGFGIGGAIPIATTLLAEFTPARRRSRAVIAGMICIPVGVFLGGIIGSLVLPHFGWRSLFAINGTLAILVCVVLLILMPESPRFLARKPARRNELRRTLRRFNLEVAADACWVDTNVLPNHISGDTVRQALFGRKCIGITLGLWGGFFFCFLASYTSLNWMPAMLSSHGYSLGFSSLALSASGAGGILASIFMSKFVELFGSRIALLFPTGAALLSASALILMPLNPAHSPLPVLLAIGVLGMSLNSLTCLAYSLSAFAYPPLAKGTGLGAAGAFGRIGAIASSYAAVAVLAVGSEPFFAFIAATALVSMLFLFALRLQIPSDRMFSSGKFR
jgi:AAHS family 4-hydroxybenzoate transporter-like MFS transporter